MFLFGIIFALPNLNPPDPAVQVSLQSAGDSFDSRLVQSVRNIVRKEGILDENIAIFSSKMPSFLTIFLTD